MPAGKVRVVHTIVYDGDERKTTYAASASCSRCRCASKCRTGTCVSTGEGDGLWAEPIQPMIGRGAVRRDHGRQSMYTPTRSAGKRVPNREHGKRRAQTLLNDWAIWDPFKLVQPNADGFTVQKRTNPQSCWLVRGGKRASGMAFVGDVTGGLGVESARISGNRIRRRSRSRHASRRGGIECGCGRRTRRRWTCAITTPKPTDSIRRTKMCSRASARRTASRGRVS